MEIQFNEPQDIPLPPNEVRIREASMERQSDGSRVRVVLQLTPFLEKPVIEIKILNDDDTVNVSSTIVETTDSQMSLTMHIKQPGANLGSRGVFIVSYPELGEVDRRIIDL